MKMTWAIEDHLCRHCGGRVLRCVTGGGPTGGGNPIFRCADCGRGASSIGPDVICWCGFAHRNNHDGAYQCLPFSAIKDRPELANAFRACGCEPHDRDGVGIVLSRDFKTQ